MMFLFYIACFVCVSSLPTSLIPVRESSVELNSSGWLNSFDPPDGYQVVGLNNFCEPGFNRMHFSTDLESRSACQSKCEQWAECGFFMWKDNGPKDRACAAFQTCGISTRFPGGVVYQRYVSDNGEVNYDTKWDFSDNDEGKVVEDSYCCGSPWSCRSNLIVDSRCQTHEHVDEDGDGDEEQVPLPEGEACPLAAEEANALWGSQANCKRACDNDPSCNYYLWRSDPQADSPRTCATFRNCVKNNGGVWPEFHDGDGGKIYKKRN